MANDQKKVGPQSPDFCLGDPNRIQGSVCAAVEVGTIDFFKEWSVFDIYEPKSFKSLELFTDQSVLFGETDFRKMAEEKTSGSVVAVSVRNQERFRADSFDFREIPSSANRDETLENDVPEDVVRYLGHVVVVPPNIRVDLGVRRIADS